MTKKLLKSHKFDEHYSADKDLIETFVKLEI